MPVTLPPPPRALPPVPPALPGRRRTRRTARVLGVLFCLLLLALGAMLLVATITASTGVVGFGIGLLLALLPVAPVVGAFLWVDRFEPEPTGILVFLFAWGAVVAALAAGLVNSVAVQVLSATRSGSAEAATAVLVAPFVEEFAKGVAVLLVAVVVRREFDGVVDGIVCAGLVGVGFAFSENVLYFGRAFLAGAVDYGLQGGVTAAGMTFLFRGVLAPFAHPLFTACTGIGIGVAVRTRVPVLRLLAPLLGYAGAVTLHGLWNFSAVGGSNGFLTSYLGLMVPLFLAVLAVVTWLRAREGRLIAREMVPYVRTGWVPPYDAAMVASLTGRQQARRWARSRVGPLGERAMRDYQRALTELAFLRDRAGRVGPAPDFPVREQALLAAVAAARRTLAPALAGQQPWR